MTATMGRARYRPEIDGLRALAVMAVILNHFDKNLLPSGYLGVDVFFVISGFVITASLAARRHTSGFREFLVSFYARRVKRILPALVFCILITAPLLCLFDHRPGESLLTGITALFGVSNLYLYKEATDYFARSSELNAFTHTWSLGVEEQFYLIFPLLIWFSGFCHSPRRGGRNLFLALCGIGTLGLVAFLIFNRSDPSAAYFLMPSRLWELGAGCLLFLFTRRTRTLSVPTRFLGPAVLAALVAALFLPQAWQAGATIAVVVLTVLLLLCLERGGWLNHWLSLPPLVKVGVLSYSLYLWHWSVLAISRWTIGIHGWTVPLQLGLIVLLAWLSYRWVEQPLRRASWSVSQLRTIGLGLGAALLACLPVWALAEPLRGRLYLGRPIAADGRRDGGPLGIDGTGVIPENCNSDSRDDEVLKSRDGFRAYAERCTAVPEQAAADGVGERRRRLFVVGDSHAMAFSPLLERLFATGRYRISIFGRPGCPFPDTPYGSSEKGCSRFMGLAAEHILSEAQPGDAVVVVGYHLSHLGDPAELRDVRPHLRDADGSIVQSASRKRELYLQALAGFAARAAGAGARTLLIGATPRNVDYDTCFQEWFNLRADAECEDTVARNLAQAERMNRRLRASLPRGVEFLDPLPILCAEGCDNEKVSELLRDSDHLTAAGVLRLYEPFVSLLEGASQRQPSG
ncbi:MAG: acyltransferase family protein [Synechococcaceae cyanobacterium]|nr:acyltransferase family protein [Synechococcaceae cyanobacterium]